MIEHFFKAWVFIWIKSNYQLISVCIIATIFMVFIGQKILGADTFDKNKDELSLEEKIKVSFAVFCAILTVGVTAAMLISYFN